jgi:hypothetical protein
MTELAFAVTDLVIEPYAVVPQLTARLRITESTAASVHALALRAQVRIEPQRRSYTEDEERGLVDLFGARERWHDTLKSFLWMQTSTMVQGFRDETQVDLPLPCTYDFEVTGSKYLHALGAGTVSLAFLFSGTVFTRGERGFSVHQVPWDREARWQMPVALWRELVQKYYANTGWLRLDGDLIRALAVYKAERGLTSWDETLRRLLGEPDRMML